MKCAYFQKQKVAVQKQTKKNMTIKAPRYLAMTKEMPSLLYCSFVEHDCNVILMSLKMDALIQQQVFNMAPGSSTYLLVMPCLQSP